MCIRILIVLIALSVRVNCHRQGRVTQHDLFVFDNEVVIDFAGPDAPDAVTDVTKTGFSLDTPGGKTGFSI